ncbi:methyl-accepting chemotaxis protein [Aliarcobacter cryaerophilus ATCC 43158]|uniref:MCP-domain signal transduction protein n=2 Tax=Pseudomonadati TaxID=3379134 RepID=A0AAD0TT59_9BACT|nr:methyl-accepting chemotaxis protein [Aliarcobacter cryaerophilus]AYJ79760.1 MCP-domain signal transduction protein [Aliarcobacter cryaerophilus ATCC 43158]PRM99598.1 methyl-accepting chemotaxis protein [Aliarcobacter cryaerophilus]QCZ23997.1 methyl-accepting chemotaxis protein [Aliarcobacter cryaerophilus ATCC 43158]
MLDFITKKISSKIIFALFLLMSISSLVIVYSTTTKVTKDSIANAKDSLEMLNASIFQTLRNTMNTGDPALIQKAENEAREIRGVKNLTVAKSRELMELYSVDTPFTDDPQILKSFDSKENQIIQTNDENGHTIRMIKPMIATPECMACHANQNVGDVIGVMDLTFSLEETDKRIQSLLKEISFTSAILGLLTIILIFFIVKKATNSIEILKEGFSNLLHSNDTNITLKVKSNDEIGDVAALFNSYMDKVREGLKQDEIVIEEANDVIEKTANGFFVYKVHNTASNHHVEDLKNKLNVMIEKTKDTLDNINEALRQYAESKYDYVLKDDTIFGNLGSLTSGINLVGNNTSELLAIVMNTGNSLKNSTQTLSDTSLELKSSSSKQAASLEETAAALEEITATIQANTQSTIKMSKLAQELSVSAQKGQELANQTAKSMDDINKEVSSINEAIEVIDQIAFQTNILSLNAAVEAATAGEAGKGFAVVAGEVRNLANRSAQAAKEIKDIVEKASSKANNGKSIANNMIDGYSELNSSISNTLVTIENVATASKEQESGILQINDAISSLDASTQKNAQVAEQISNMATSIAYTSNYLVTASSRTSFIKDSLDKVDNVDLVYDTALLKTNLLKKKDEVYSKLGDYKNFNVIDDNSIKDWLNSNDNASKILDKKLLENIKVLDTTFYKNLQDLVISNSNADKPEILNIKASAAEKCTTEIFKSLDDIKFSKKS